MYWLSSRFYVPEWGRFLTPDDIDYLDSESINGLNLYCYCLNNPVMLVDPSGHMAIWATALIGGLIALGTAYEIDVVNNFKDGVEWEDFNTFKKDSLIKYGCAFIGGVVSGALGAVGSTGLKLFGTFVGEMIESAYTFNSWENVGNAILISALATSLDGFLTISKNKATRKMLESGMDNLSNKATKQVKRFISEGIEPTSVQAQKLINKTLKYHEKLDKFAEYLLWMLT